MTAWRSITSKPASGPAPVGSPPAPKCAYIEREGRYERDLEELEHTEHGHMPDWAEDDPGKYWAAADEHERANGRLYSEVQFALPKELSESQRREAASHSDRPGAAALYAGDSPRRPGRRESPRAPDVLRARS